MSIYYIFPQCLGNLPLPHLIPLLPLQRFPPPPLLFLPRPPPRLLLLSHPLRHLRRHSLHPPPLSRQTPPRPALDRTRLPTLHAPHHRRRIRHRLRKRIPQHPPEHHNRQPPIRTRRPAPRRHIPALLLRDRQVLAQNDSVPGMVHGAQWHGVYRS